MKSGMSKLNEKKVVFYFKGDTATARLLPQGVLAIIGGERSIVA